MLTSPASLFIINTFNPTGGVISPTSTTINVNIPNQIAVSSGDMPKSNVIIKGPIIIGDGCVIEKDTEIGPNISVGDNSIISGCKISNSIIMDNSEIRCKEKIHNSIISAKSKILTSDDQGSKTLLLGEGTKITL